MCESIREVTGGLQKRHFLILRLCCALNPYQIVSKTTSVFSKQVSSSLLSFFSKALSPAEILSTYLCCVFSYCIISTMRAGILLLFCSLLSLQCLEQYLTPHRGLMDVCWIVTIWAADQNLKTDSMFLAAHTIPSW